MSDVNKIAATIRGAIDRLGEGAAKRQPAAFRELMALVKKLETRGDTLLNNLANLKLINDIKVRVERLLIDQQYKSELKDFGQAFKQLAQLHNDYFAGFSAFSPGKRLDLLTENAVQTTLVNLTETGLQAGVTDPLRKVLLSNVAQGGSYAALTEQLRGLMLEDKNTPGALQQYVRTYATTAINQFSAEYNKTISDDLGLEWHMYTGSLLTTSRPWCIKAAEQIYIHVCEFKRLLTGDFGAAGTVPIYKKTDLPEGLMEGTTPTNLVRRRGGWNCGHQMVGVDDTAVPLAVRDALYATEEYKAWARAHGQKPKGELPDTVLSMRQAAREGGGQVTRFGEAVAKKFDGVVTGINYKGWESMERKVRDELGGNVQGVKDAVRNTVVVKYEDIARVVDALKADPRYKAENGGRIKVQEGPAFFGYKGVITNFRTANGVTAEMQINSPGMIYAKESKASALHVISEAEYNRIANESGLPGGLGHKFYDQIRVLVPKVKDGIATPEEILELTTLEKQSTEYYQAFYRF